MGVKKCRSCARKIGGDTGMTDAGRGLCTTCHSRHLNDGTLADFPRKTWKAEDLVAEADLLRTAGVGREEIAERLGVKWVSIMSAKQRLRTRAESKARDETMTGPDDKVYVEHEKLAKIAPLSQAIGEFLECLEIQGVRLMRWTETIDIEACDGTMMDTCRGEACQTCGGANVVEVKRSGWAPYGISIATMLAQHFEIDQTKIETEKREMLEDLRKRNGG